MHCENSTHVIPGPLPNHLPMGKVGGSYTETLSLGLGSSLKSAMRSFSSQSQQEKPSREEGGSVGSPGRGEVPPHM